MHVQYLLLLLVIGTLEANNEKSLDEGNPYEFGFTIDGQQHRHEKKDSKGIIQGEFGFITADGIYHVTVYATDENGDFKILSMKNLRISAPLDGSSFKGEISPEANKYRKQANLPPISSVEKSANSPLVKTAAPKEFSSAAKIVEPLKFTTQATVRPGCASCGYITTQKPQPVQINSEVSPFNNKNSFNQQEQQRLNNNQNPSAVHPSSQNRPNHQFNTNTELDDETNQNPAQYQNNLPNKQQRLQNPLSFSQINQQQEDRSSFVGSGGILSNQNKIPQYNLASGPHQNTAFNHFEDSASLSKNNNAGLPSSDGSNPLTSGQYPQIPQTLSKDSDTSSSLGYNAESNPFTSDGQYPQTPQTLNNKDSAGSNPLTSPLGENSQLPQSSSALSTLPPVSVSDGVIHVGGEKAQDIPIKDKFPGMQDGLPEGIEEKDITNILYKFHYTVGFHGHYEKGLKNGTKIGGYFVNGRDGISRVVTYVADENGYRPKVKFINLGLDSAETPKAETEKTFGLKSFEFVWYPL